MKAASPDSSQLAPATVGFTLAAAVTVLFNTGLAWAKDAYPALNTFMASLAGHHWTTHGLADLALFLGLGFFFTRSKAGGKMDPAAVTGALIGAVALAAFGLAAWFAFV